MKEEASGKKSPRKITAVAAIVLILVGLSVTVVLYFSMKTNVSNCVAGKSQPEQTSERGSLLSGFSVACIRILNGGNNSSILNGFVYVAQTGEEQTQGFQNVTSFGNCNGLASGRLNCDGMIFNFSSNQEVCFWMHNTILPLQQDWIAQNGTVTYVFQAKPQNNSSVCYFGKYVLETNPNESISTGDTVLLNSNQT